MKTEKLRRREGKTDYKARLSLLKSGIPRIVVRKTNRYIIAQCIKSKEAQDSVVIGLTSKELIKYGWPKEWQGSLKSIPAAYLTGFLLGKRILDEEKKAKAILDMGLMRNVKGGRIYAVLAGLIDAGVEIKCKKEMLPEKERIIGMHMKKDIEKKLDEIKEKINKE